MSDADHPACTASEPAAPTIFCLHFLGGNAREWQAVAALLAPRLRCVALDLAGFGDRAGETDTSVAGMADRIAEAVKAARPGRWALAGHSMGAKIACLLARRAEDGESGLEGLSHLVTLAGSPPCPEPMQESRRETMLGWFKGSAARSRLEAEGFIDQNTARVLDAPSRTLAVEGVLQADPRAWRAWLEQGSREDLAATVGRLRTPALVLAGEEDGDLGPDAQHRLMAPHFTHRREVTVKACAHLLPLEQPGEVARLILQHVGQGGPAMGEAYAALIASDRTSTRTREALLARAVADEPGHQPIAMTAAQLGTLRAVLDRVLPQPGPGRIDLGARLDRLLGAGVGDGWRFAALPPDPEAMVAGLGTLDAAASDGLGAPFASLDGAAQDALLARIADGHAAGGGLLDPGQMRLWFEDVRAAAVGLYVAHPATLARMGYGGMACGGDGSHKAGFSRVGPGEREGWEPEAFRPGA